MRAALTLTDRRPLAVRLAEAELDLRIARRRLLDVERRMVALPQEEDVEPLDLEREDTLRELDRVRMHCNLLHDESTEHLVPDEHRLRPARAA